MTGTPTPAGWYTDPERPGLQRYWDGSRWTEHRAPVAAPSAPTWTPAGQVAATGYRTMRSLATALTVLLIVMAAVSLLEAVAHFNRSVLIDDVLDGRNVSFQELEDADDAVFGATALSLLVLLATGVVFIVWLHRGYRNAESFGRHDLRLSAGWTIGAWFIPVYNFIGPKLIVNDLWRAADPTLAPGDHNWKPRPVAGIIHVWWALFVIQSVLGAIGGFDNEADSFDDLERLADIDRVNGLGSLVAIAAAILGIIVVRRLSDRFSARARTFGFAP